MQNRKAFGHFKAPLCVGMTLLLLAPSIAVAGAAEDIANINERVLLLSAQLSELELKAKIASKQAEVDRAGAPVGGHAALPLPVVRAIDSYRKRWVATLAFPGGQSTVASVGDILPNGYRVQSIAVNEVLIVRGKTSERLTFGIEPPKTDYVGDGGFRMPAGQPNSGALGPVPGARQ